jgi:hypothetical protein
VLVWRIANPVDGRALFGKRCLPVHVVALLAEFHGVAVQMGQVVGHDGAVGIGPWSVTDAVAGVYGGLDADSLGAQVGSPGPLRPPGDQ